MNQLYVHMNQPYAMLTRASVLREVFRVQSYKKKIYTRVPLSHILSIINSDGRAAAWAQFTRSVWGP